MAKELTLNEKDLVVVANALGFIEAHVTGTFNEDKNQQLGVINKGQDDIDDSIEERTQELYQRIAKAFNA